MSKKTLAIATFLAIGGAVAWKERKALADTLERWTNGKL
jgi:hypothetical protein